VRIAKDQSGSALHISGNLSVETAEELRAALLDVLAAASDVSLDLSAVEACDTAALQVFCSACKTAGARGKTLELVGMPDAVVRTALELGLPVGGA
jgi:anti-anti-sigma factor